MPQDSKRKRYLRRLKRELSIKNRLLDMVLRQRDAYKNVGQELAMELGKKEEQAGNLIVSPTLGQIAQASGLAGAKE